MKSHSDSRPAAIVPLGNGAYHYNYNITSRRTAETDTEEEATLYDYDTVKVWGIPTYGNLVKAVIRERLDETREFSLINGYNAAVLELTADGGERTAAVEAYKAHLAFVAGVKAMVRRDLAAAGTDIY